MYLKDTDFRTLEDLAADVVDRRLTATGSSTMVQVRLDDGTEEPDTASHEEGMHRRGTITLGKKEIPATAKGLMHLASYYDVPTKFLDRIPPDEQQFILDHRIQRSADTPIVLRYDDTGISEAYDATHNRVTPEMLIERLLDFLPEDSQVVDWFDLGAEFWGSIIVPEGYDRGIGGDRKVGDLTYGGIRFGRNVKQNLAPWVQTYMFRLACTNGVEIPDYGLKIEARGANEEDIAMMFGSEAKRAFEKVGKSIEHFYELRSVKVEDDRTGLFRRLALDAGISARMVGNMEDTLADALMAEDEVSMFHLVNHVTNQANQPGLRINAYRTLQQAGGEMIADHASRCNLCHSKMN